MLCYSHNPCDFTYIENCMVQHISVYIPVRSTCLNRYGRITSSWWFLFKLVQKMNNIDVENGGVGKIRFKNRSANTNCCDEYDPIRRDRAYWQMIFLHGNAHGAITKERNAHTTTTTTTIIIIITTIKTETEHRINCAVYSHFPLKAVVIIMKIHNHDGIWKSTWRGGDIGSLNPTLLFVAVAIFFCSLFRYYLFLAVPQKRKQ